MEQIVSEIQVVGRAVSLDFADKLAKANFQVQ
jgi:hypothetical protein